MSGRVSSSPRSGERLRERRRKHRRNLLIVVGVLLLLLLGASVYGFWQPSVRIKRVEVFGSTLPLQPIVLETIAGSYLGIIPRDSIFFYPERDIRSRIIATYGAVATISFFNNGLDGLTLKVTSRVPIARWCPDELTEIVSSSTPREEAYAECYLFDDRGLLFATSSEVALVNPFLVHAPLDPTAEIRGQILPERERLPAAFNFARQLGSFGSSAISVAVATPEATITLKKGTRVTYVLGKEEEAYAALTSAKEKVNLNDGSIDYVDLRFSGKVYLKRKGDTVPQ